MAIKHTKVVTTPDDGTSEVGTDEWNDNHTIDDNTITNDQLAGNVVATTKLSASGTKDSSTYLRGDDTWATISGIPSGVILMWSGSLASIPAGWNLCDGNNGTPNLIAKFVRSIQTASTETGTTGGSDAVTLTGAESGTSAHGHGGSTNSTGSHSHTQNVSTSEATHSASSGNGANGALAGTRSTSSNGSHSHTVTVSNSSEADASSSHENRPAYFELAYIMKA